MERRSCGYVKDDGGPCRSPPLTDGEFCVMHSPEHAGEMEDARRLGGLRRRKERAVAGAYDIEGLEDVGQIRRVLMIATIDTLSLENSVARSRTLAYLMRVALRVHEVGELEERIAALEQALGQRRGQWQRRKR